jgi:hypothetical protein
LYLLAIIEKEDRNDYTLLDEKIVGEMMEKGDLVALPPNALWHYKSDDSKYRYVLLLHQETDLNDLETNNVKYFRHVDEGYIISARRVQVSSIIRTQRDRSHMGLAKHDLYFFRPAGENPGGNKMVIRFLKMMVVEDTNGYSYCCLSVGSKPPLRVNLLLHRGTTSIDSGVNGGGKVADHRLGDDTSGPRSGHGRGDAKFASVSENNTGKSTEEGAKYEAYGHVLPPNRSEEFDYSLQHPVQKDLYFSGDGWAARMVDETKIPFNQLLLTSKVTKAGAGWVEVHVERYGSLHRLLVEAVLGRKLLLEETVDHLNGNRMDNRIIMLAVVSKEEQCLNRARSVSNTSGYTGIGMNIITGAWVVKWSDDKGRHCKSFKDISEAIAYRNERNSEKGNKPDDRDSERRKLAGIVAEQVRLQLLARRAAVIARQQNKVHNLEDDRELLDADNRGFIAFDEDGIPLPPNFWTKAAKGKAALKKMADARATVKLTPAVAMGKRKGWDPIILERLNNLWALALVTEEKRVVAGVDGFIPPDNIKQAYTHLTEVLNVPKKKVYAFITKKRDGLKKTSLNANQRALLFTVFYTEGNSKIKRGDATMIRLLENEVFGGEEEAPTAAKRIMAWYGNERHRTKLAAKSRKTKELLAKAEL